MFFCLPYPSIFFLNNYFYLPLNFFLFIKVNFFRNFYFHVTDFNFFFPLSTNLSYTFTLSSSTFAQKNFLFATSKNKLQNYLISHGSRVIHLVFYLFYLFIYLFIFWARGWMKTMSLSLYLYSYWSYPLYVSQEITKFTCHKKEKKRQNLRNQKIFHFMSG